MLNWLIENVSLFKIQHDAHNEFRMSVDEYLSHRARVGDCPDFCDAADRAACIEGNRLWELHVMLAEGIVVNIAGASLNGCVNAAKNLSRGLPAKKVKDVRRKTVAPAHML